MSIKYPCYIEFSDSGRLARLVHKNGTVLAELLVHGPFETRTNQAHTHPCSCGHPNIEHRTLNRYPTANGNPTPGMRVSDMVPDTHCLKCDCVQYKEMPHRAFQGELWGLSEWEQIDTATESVVESNKERIA